jgi:hypothetical protein
LSKFEILFEFANSIPGRGAFSLPKGKCAMRYFALYQREFSGRPRTLTPDSHIFIDYTTADDLEEVFAQFQSEVMTETRRCRVMISPVRHTSMSVGDLLIDEAGRCHAVMPVGFLKLGIVTLETRTELALHLLALGLERTPGWRELFEQDPALLAAAIAQRLRTNAYGTAKYARAPRPIPTALETTP